MKEPGNATLRSKGLNGKWLVALIVGAGVVLAVIGGKFNKYKSMPAEPATEPAGR